MVNGGYLTPAGYGEAVLVEKRSRFIARVWPAGSESDALSRIGEVRKRHWDAAHNVYAYAIHDGPARCGDDGEPHGTSGPPTLKVFQAQGVYDVCCVVTRYFGGALLGAGGLVRAYSGAAKLALEAAGLSLARRWDVALIPAPYALFKRIKLRIELAGGMVGSSDFGADVLIEALVPPENTPALFAAIRELSSGRIEPEVLETRFKSVKL
ncbi:MAG: YigZ family protein [Planctomycetota bacterium]|jgi:uncharacterized YigZ family protein|nr:YigZ family protein [Planctomycetota bacterium]